MHFLFIHNSVKHLSTFDVVIVNDYPLSWIGYYTRNVWRHSKYVLFLQGLQLPASCEYFLEKAYFTLQTKLFYRLSMSNHDLVITETAFLQNQLHHLGVDSILAPNPTELSLLSKQTPDSIHSQFQLGDDPVILYIDRLEKHKGIDILLDAFRIVRQSIPHIKLMMVGNCTRKRYLAKIKAKLDSSIILIDYVPHEDISAYYKSATIFVTCAVYEEGLSHTILEAQASGKPVVAFKIPAHEEIVRDGETGFLVKSVGDSSEFASAVIRLLSDKELVEVMGEKAMRWSACFSESAEQHIDNMLKRIERL
jgi:glycosyltransferase involved in cell wall biosynthesis